jgi:peptidoglycan/LPS O-acetylase OafA/YrhL
MTTVIHAGKTSGPYAKAVVGRIPELDGLRGIAIGMVVVHHYFLQAIQTAQATPLSYLRATGRLMWSGVDLFFVISGFLIGGILLDARESSNYFQVFYTRRFFRIVPIYFVFLTVALLLHGLGVLGIAQRLARMYQNPLPWAPYFLFLQNFWMAYGTAFGVSGLAVTWSLAVEEQFYLTLPVLVRTLNLRRLVTVLCAGILLAPALRIALWALWPARYLSWYMLMPCRADALLLGVLGAMALRDPSWRTRLEKNRPVMMFLLAILTCGFLVMTKSYADPASFPMLSAGFSWLAAFYLVVLMCAVLYPEGWLSQSLRWRWLGWLGAIAYGVYLFHEFIRQIVFGLIWSRYPRLATLPDILTTMLALAITLVVCRLSWLYFEKPLVQRGHRLQYQFDAPAAPEPISAPEMEGSAG